MKYYVIEKPFEYGSNLYEVMCFVEHKEIAQDIVKKYNNLVWIELETTENKDE